MADGSYAAHPPYRTDGGHLDLSVYLLPRSSYCGALSQSVEIQFDHVLPCAIYSSQNLAATSAVQLTADSAESFCKADSGPWSTGRELRLVIDSLLI